MISIVIPCHNEEPVLPQLFARLSSAAAEWPDDYEVILVDDGSTDGTWSWINRLRDRDPRWKGLSLARNFGHQAAIGAGLHYARGDAVVVLDADLQDPPELIADMIQRWREGFEIVYGVRARRTEGPLKRWCYALYYRLLARVSEVPIPRDAGDFCLMDRRVVKALRAFPEQRPFWRGLRSWSGFRQIGIPYDRPGRKAGVSHYSWLKLLRLASDGLFAMSRAPLRAVTWAGSLACALVLVRMVIGWCQGQGAVGGGTLLWCGLSLAAVQLLSMGVLGAYVGRIYDEARRRPRWLVAATVGLPRRNPRGSKTRLAAWRHGLKPAGESTSLRDSNASALSHAAPRL